MQPIYTTNHSNKLVSIFFIFLFFFNFAYATTPTTTVHIAKLAFRPALDEQKHWQPLVEYLNEKIPGYHFQIDALNYKELESAIARREVDFVFTNPGHYILMTYRNGLSSPLATIITSENKHNLSKFGGVIITRADRKEIDSLESLRGHTVAVVTKGSLGGYQAQAFELLSAGLKIPRDIKLLETDMPHDLVVKAVIEGKTEAGFVRTGVLEHMVYEGKLDLAQIKIIAPKDRDGFPLLLSTRLYPEWPFSAMPSIDDNLARMVAGALLSLPHGGKVADALSIHGFTIPTEYEAIRSTLEQLRLPPFDAAPLFTVYDVLKKYQWEFIVTIILMALIIFLILWLIYLNRQLVEGRQLIELASSKWHRLLTAIGEGVYGVDAQGRCTFVNPAALAMLGFDKQDILGKDQHLLFHHHRENGSPYPAIECPISLTIKDTVARNWKDWFWRKDGSGFAVSLTTAPMDNNETVVVFRDISAQRALEIELRREATTDPLTGIANRRLFMEQLGKELSRFKRFNELGVVIMVDIDYFKRVNDRYGHAIGDEVLKHFTNTAQQVLRNTDLIGRLGGEEFGIMLPVTDILEASLFAERLRSTIANAPAHTSQEKVSYTISLGISEFIFNDSTPDSILNRADSALYRAKKGGRNRVEIAINEPNLPMKEIFSNSFVHLHWKENYTCGETTIDNEHRKLFQIANHLLDLATQPQDTVVDIKATFNQLLVHVAEHFHHEENILRSKNYSKLVEHIEIHQNLIEHAKHLIEQIDHDEVPLKEIVNFLLIDVVANHLLHEDMKFFSLFKKS